MTQTKQKMKKSEIFGYITLGIAFVMITIVTPIFIKTGSQLVGAINSLLW